MQIAEITRAETSHRAELLSVGSYTVDLDLTCGDKVFRSISVITSTVPSPARAVMPTWSPRPCTRSRLNGTGLDPGDVCANGRITLPGLAAHNELRVVADCAYAADSKGMHRAVDSADGKVYCYTNFEPADARRAYAELRAAGPEGHFYLQRDRARALGRAVQPAVAGTRARRGGRERNGRRRPGISRPRRASLPT